MSNEADTCRTYVLPKLQAAGWADEQIREQLIFTAGRIVVADRKARRARPKHADYVLYYRRDYPLAVVEAKANYRQPAEGMQQAKDYAQILGLSFAYATNGKRVIAFDFTRLPGAGGRHLPQPDGPLEPLAHLQRLRPGTGRQRSRYRMCCACQ